MNSERNLPNLVIDGGGDVWTFVLSLSMLGLIIILKSPNHITGTVGCLAMKAIPSCRALNWNGGGI